MFKELKENMQEVLKPKLSVIVTAYNVSEYIAQCLDSVLAQDYKDMEIIVVNAESTDNSGEICKTYAEKFPVIKYIECENTGPGGTRNAGIKIAQGEYLGFVDGDDIIEPDRFSAVMEYTENGEFDAVYCTCYRFFNDDLTTRSIRHIEEFECEGKAEIWQEMILPIIANTKSDKEVPGTMCFGIFRKNIIDDNDIQALPMEEVFSEDNFFNIEFLRCAKKIKAIDKPLYNYRMRISSVSNAPKDYAIPATLNFCKRVKEFAANDGIDLAETDKRCKIRFIVFFSTIVKKKIDSDSLKNVKKYIKQIKKDYNVDFRFERSELKNLKFQVRLFQFLLEYKMYTVLYIFVKVYSRFIRQ